MTRRCFDASAFRAVICFSAVVVNSPARAQDPGPCDDSRVYPPGSTVHSKSISEWTAEWWQWAAAIPADVNPLRDETGEDCGIDVRGWLLVTGLPIAARQLRVARQECFQFLVVVRILAHDSLRLGLTPLQFLWFGLTPL